MRLRAATVVATAGAVVLLGLIAPPNGASADSSSNGGGQAGTLDFRGSHGNNHQAPSNLVDHGGKILFASHTYAVWWGDSSAWPTGVQSGIDSLFLGFNGSSFLNTAAQYMRGDPISSVNEGATSDPSAPPKKVNPSTLGAEVQKVYGTSLDPQGIYFIYTSNAPAGGNFCAWHALTTVNGQSIAVAYMPNITGLGPCDPGNLYGTSGSEGLRSIANVTSHEFMEAVTDTLPSSKTYGWIGAAGQEIGDKCAWQFAGPVTLGNGTVWQLQEEWSNAVTGCVQTT